MPFECRFLRWMRHYTKSRFGDWFMPRATRLGDYGAVWIALALGMLFFRRTRRPAVQLLVTLAIESLLCNTFLKPFVGRPRPFELSSKVRPLIAPPQDRSFPSGHTASSVAAAASLCLSRCPLWKGALPLALLIAWSRLYVCVHFATDILGGAAAGLLSARAGQVLMKKIVR